jgi:hypothetical protein
MWHSAGKSTSWQQLVARASALLPNLLPYHKFGAALLHQYSNSMLGSETQT